MDVQDQTTPSGHESHGVHICHRCGWPFPNPHPSARHRRAHKKICGTIEGYTNLIGSEVISDDEQHSDSDKEKTPSPKIEIRGSFTGSEDVFTDAVTEFVDSGSANKSLDKDVFFSFKDAENAGTKEVLNAPLEPSKVDASIEVSEKADPHVEKTEETEIKTVSDSSQSNLELTGTGDLAKDGVVGPAPEPSHVSQSQEAKSIDVMEAGEEKGQESQTSEINTKEASDPDITKTSLEVSEIVGGYHDNVKQENSEKLESVTTGGMNEGIIQEIKPDCEHVSEVVNESETVKEFKTENFEADREIAAAVVKGSKVDHLGGAGEEIKHEKFESDHKHVPEVAKESETDQNVSVVNEKVDLDAPNEQIQEAFKDPVAVLTENKDLEAPELEKGSREHIQEVVTEPVAVLIENDNLGGPQLEKQSIEHTHEAVEMPDAIVTEKDLDTPELEKSSREHIQEAVKEPVAVLIENDNLGGPQLEKQSIEHTHEAVERPGSIVTEKDLDTPKLEKSSKEQIQEVVKEHDMVLTEKEDLVGTQLEKQSIEHTHEVAEKPDSILTEKDLGTPELGGSSKEQIQEVVKEPDTVLTQKEDLGGPHLEKQPTEHTHEVVEKPDIILIEKQNLGAPESIVEERDLVLNEKEDLAAHKSDKCLNDEVTEQKVNSDHNLAADVSTGTMTLKDSSDNSATNSKNASGVVPESILEEGNGKLMNNQDSGADLTVDSSSHNSLEGTWGSVSVLSTASIDAETLQLTEKSKVNSGKSNAATSDVFEPPSFMTLVESESKDNKSGSSELQDSQQQPNSEASRDGWFPTLAEVNNESEGRKRNEEAMAKVTNWSTGKQSTPLKNLLGEAKSPSGKQPEPVVQKDEATVNPTVNDEVLSPPKLIDDDKKGRKKVKGLSSWVPFGCCSSVNAVK